MSYRFSISACPVEGLRDHAWKAAAQCKANLTDWPEEADGDVDAAIDAAERLAMALADDDDRVHVDVIISGHANAGRQPPQGWSPDSVFVSVNRARVAATTSAGG